INLIASYPVTRRTSFERTLDHASRQLRLGGKLRSFRHRCGAATILISGPLFWKVQFTIHQCRALVTGVAKKHAHLAVLDAPRRARVLALDPDRMQTLLQKTG